MPLDWVARQAKHGVSMFPEPSRFASAIGAGSRMGGGLEGPVETIECAQVRPGPPADTSSVCALGDAALKGGMHSATAASLFRTAKNVRNAMHDICFCRNSSCSPLPRTTRPAHERKENGKKAPTQSQHDNLISHLICPRLCTTTAWRQVPPPAHPVPRHASRRPAVPLRWSGAPASKPHAHRH